MLSLSAVIQKSKDIRQELSLSRKIIAELKKRLPIEAREMELELESVVQNHAALTRQVLSRGATYYDHWEKQADLNNLMILDCDLFEGMNLIQEIV